MLTDLSIYDVVLIDQLDLSFSSGLSALTGETGAGKSIVLDALGLALGVRADRSLVRAGAKQARVIATFNLEPDHLVWALLAERELDADRSEDLVLRRTLSEDGKSKSFINDIPVSASLMREVGNLLVEIHGQHDGRGLMDVRTHILALDMFGGFAKLVDKCSNAYQTWKQAISAAEQLNRQANADAAEQVYLQEAASELDRLDPKSGEEQALAGQRSMMMQTEKLLSDLQSARTALEAGSGIDGQVGAALRNVETALSRFEPDIEDNAVQKLLQRSLQSLESGLVEIETANIAMDDAARQLVLEPGELEQSEERLFALRAVARKHKVDVEQLSSVRSDLSARLQALENLEQAQAKASQEVQKAYTEYAKIADDLSQKRQKAANKLDKEILKELAPLRLEKAKFLTRVEVQDPQNGSANGIDKVGFEISTNPGVPLGPLASIASGGELSRIALAIKAALAANFGPSVMVFDEIDQGVGGSVADAVGRRLALLAAGCQVLVITHSPQVAALASAQFQIEKSETKGVSRTSVVLLTDNEREEEIARMLAGAIITEQAREAAKSLLS
ncbi:MAG: DNA repair protein RecN [Robiginitomaculum sp.]|nr:DNA repair protein RecN [Robiginitomaculum sp.]